MFEIIPAIDILDGNVVRLTQGDYAQVDSYAVSPVDIAKQFADAGAKRIHIVDLNGAKEGRLVNQSVIEAIRKSVPSCKLDFGGGIRSKEIVKQVFDMGLDWVVLGSMLIKQPDEALDIIQAYPSKIIASLDAKGDKIAIEGWKTTSLISVMMLVQQLSKLKLAALVYTDISKDGTLLGPNLEGLANIASLTTLPVIASGGIGTLDDIEKVKALRPKGVIGCIVGKAILSGKLKLAEVFAL